jgi:hypothetical protein
MIVDEIYSISLVRFAATLSLKDHTHYPKKLHDNCVMELNRMCFMYEKDEYKLSKVEGFKPFFGAPSTFVVSPREGDSYRIP